VSAGTRAGSHVEDAPLLDVVARVRSDSGHAKERGARLLLLFEYETLNWRSITDVELMP